MDPYLHEWLNLLLRWLHITAGIAWIGASFYFNWLEGRLERGSNQPTGIAGDLWAVHGGGFYHLQKYEVAPPQLPKTLHWFKWEAYVTWMSGLALLLVVYYLNPGLYLLGANPMDLTPWQGEVIGLGSLVLGWLLYDGLCKTALVQRPAWFAGIGFTLFVLLAWGLSQLFTGRAAYIQVGATIGTIMAANVFFVIIPAQKRMVDALLRKQVPDAAQGHAAALRSLHNNYLTLPVLFIMISNHFPSTFSNPHPWQLLAGLALISAGIRHFFNLRNRGHLKVWILPVAAVSLLALAVASHPAATPPQASDSSFPQVQEIIQQRCVACHSAQPSNPAFATAPNGFMLDHPEQIRQAAALIEQRAVATRSMPLGNLTHMTEQERAVLAAWIKAGAKTSD